MKNKTYSAQQLVLEVQKRLSILHNVSNDFTIGKNKLYFMLDGQEVCVLRNKEKVNNNRKTICEYLEMFPCTLFPSSGDKYQESDVIKLTTWLDGYIITKLINQNISMAFSNQFYYLKSILRPFFLDIEENVFEEILIGLLTSQESVKKIFIFTADNLDADKVNTIFVICDNEKISLIIYNSYNENIVASSINEDCLKEYEFNLAEYSETSLIKAISKILKLFSNFKLCSGNITTIPEEKDSVNNEEQEGELDDRIDSTN